MLEDSRQKWFEIAPELQANPKNLSYDQRFRNHPRNKGKARKANKKGRPIAGRLVRDVERKLGAKVNVQCISKEKEHKLYEFENKVSITRTGTGVIAGALSFRNEFDGHTLDKAIEQVEKLTERKLRNGIFERGYRGRSKVRDTLIHIPKSFKKALSTYRKNKERKYFRKCASIDPVIGHLKEDHRDARSLRLQLQKDDKQVEIIFLFFFGKIFLFLDRKLTPIRSGIILQTKESWAF